MEKNSAVNSIGLKIMAVMLMTIFWASSGNAGRSLQEVEAANNQKLTASWSNIKPGQRDSSSFALSRNGTLSHGSTALQPAIQVVEEQGKPAGTPSSIAISPLSPSRNFALLTACEPPGAATDLCWFQYLVDLAMGKVHETTWAKYPAPVYVWWGRDDLFAVVPVAEEGEVWLAAINLKTHEGRDIHVNDFAQNAARSLNCKLNDDQYSLDLDSIEWIKRDEIALSVTMVCGSPPKTHSVQGSVNLNTGTVRNLSATTAKHHDEVAVGRLDESTLRNLVTDYYNTRSEWAGTFSLVAVRNWRVEELGENRKLVHVDYKYAAVPGNRQGRQDSGYDQRTFDLQWSQGRWRVVNMGGNKSGRL